MQNDRDFALNDWELLKYNWDFKKNGWFFEQNISSDKQHFRDLERNVKFLAKLRRGWAKCIDFDWNLWDF